MGDPVKKHLTTCKHNGLSHMWPKLGSNPQQWDDERFRVLKIGGLNHSAMGAAKQAFYPTNIQRFKMSQHLKFPFAPPNHPSEYHVGLAMQVHYLPSKDVSAMVIW